MPMYEITYHCVDDDWLSWRLTCNDFHEAVEAALLRLNMAVDHKHMLHNARLLRIERITPKED